MNMSFAFETTPDDVENVLTQNKERISDKYLDRFEDDSSELASDLHDEFIVGDGSIEKAALRSTDLDTQTEYAYAEIERILTENGVLK